VEGGPSWPLLMSCCRAVTHLEPVAATSTPTLTSPSRRADNAYNFCLIPPQLSA
jgi:hypothetical protein